LDEFDDAIADFSARREFDCLRAAIEVGLEVGAAGRMLEWADELDYYCVGESPVD
jgi:predicted transcriptional regulator